MAPEGLWCFFHYEKPKVCPKNSKIVKILPLHYVKIWYYKKELMGWQRERRC